MKKEEDFWGSSMARAWCWPWTIFLFIGVGIGPAVLWKASLLSPLPGLSCIMTPFALAYTGLYMLKKLAACIFWDSKTKRYTSDLWATPWSTSPTWQKLWVYNIPFFISLLFPITAPLLTGSFRQRIFVLKFFTVTPFPVVSLIPIPSAIYTCITRLALFSLKHLINSFFAIGLALGCQPVPTLL